MIVSKNYYEIFLLFKKKLMHKNMHFNFKRAAPIKKQFTEIRGRSQVLDDGYYKTNVIFYVYSNYKIRGMNFFNFQDSLKYFNLLTLMTGLIFLEKYLFLRKDHRSSISKFYVSSCIIASKILHDEPVEISKMYKNHEILLELEKEILFTLKFNTEVEDKEVKMLGRKIFPR